MSTALARARRTAAAVIAGWLLLAAPGAAPGQEVHGGGSAETCAELTRFLREVIGDSTVRAIYTGLDRNNGVEYFLETPAGSRWTLQINDALPSEQEARAKFRPYFRIPIAPTVVTNEPGRDLAIWRIPAGAQQIYLRRGVTLAGIGPGLDPAELLRKTDALDRLLQTGEMQRTTDSARQAGVALRDAAERRTPAPTPRPTPEPGVTVFLKGDPDMIPFLREVLDRPAAGPLTNEASADANARRDAVVNLADLAEPSTLPLLRRVAADKHEYPTVRAMAGDAARRIEVRPHAKHRQAR